MTVDYKNASERLAADELLFRSAVDTVPRIYYRMYNIRERQGLACLFSLALIAGTSPQKSISARREQVPFSMAIGNGELMHECFPKHQRMGTAR